MSTSCPRTRASSIADNRPEARCATSGRSSSTALFLTRFRRGRRFDRVALHRLRRGIGTSRVLGVALGDSVPGTARTECTLALRSRRPSEEHADRDEREHDENESHAELHLVGRPLSSSE
jgi:hypothetical protein